MRGDAGPLEKKTGDERERWAMIGGEKRGEGRSVEQGRSVERRGERIVEKNNEQADGTV